jgi:transmembrane sensor
VVAADIHATVLGTVFTLRLEPDTVVLSVESGSVRLRWSEGDVVVAGGERRVVPRHSSKPQPEQPKPAASDEPPHPTAAPSVSVPSWRDLAQQAKYAAAYESLTHAGPSAVRDEPGDLLLAADVTRLGGHPGEAITWLRRVVDGHAGDSRAPLAAFTLGRVYLDQLGSPAQAAAAFAQARRMAPGGALAEDALAREVEARARSGDASGARSLAERYLERYPKGRRAASVRRQGGLDLTP